MTKEPTARLPRPRFPARSRKRKPAKPLLARVPIVAVFEDDWRSRPDEKHPYPIVLLHGTGKSKSDWAQLGAQLRHLGFAVYAPDFGHRATAPMRESAAQISAYMDAVFTVTGATKVILVGHSQGGLLARMWAAEGNNAARVHQIVSLAAPHHGTRPGGMMAPLVRGKQAHRTVHSLIHDIFGPAGAEMLGDSEIITALNEKEDGLLPGVIYSNLATRSDAIVLPIESCFLEGPGCVNRFIQGEKTLPIVRHDELPTHRLAMAVTIEEIFAHHPIDLSE